MGGDPSHHAARNTRLLPGDVLGSGTVGTGCILEHGDGRWLEPGDVVELEVEGIGVLRNTVGPRPDVDRGYPPAMPFYQRLGDVPRKRHIQFRDNGLLLTEEVFGLEGFSGNESILYHLQSPCRVKELGPFEPIERDEWVPEAHAHRHLRTWDIPPEGDAIGGRRLLMWNEDVEISLCRPARDDGGLLPERRGRRGRLRPRGHRARWRRSSATCPTGRATTSSSRAARPTASRPRARSATSSSSRPGLIEIPRRYRNEYGQLLEHAPYYHRDIHPPTELQTHREQGDFVVKVRVRDGYQTYVLDYHPFDVVGWDGYVYPWTFNDPRLRADHRADPHAAAVAPDLRGHELRHLLVLPAQARLRPAGDPDPVPPLES